MKKLNNKIFTTLSVFLLVFMLTNNIISQENHFVYLENDNFYLQCEEFYPVAMNYQIGVIEDNSGEFHVAPSSRYCWNGSCGGQMNCGVDSVEWHEQIVEHLEKIVDLKFNCIRLVGGLSNNYDTATEMLVSNFYRLQGTNPNSYTTIKPGFEINSSVYERKGDLLEEFIGIIKNNNIPLKIILLTGGNGFENVADEQADYLSYIANRFKDEPVIFAYDMYNEPSYWMFPSHILQGKQTRIETVDKWHTAIKEASPLHLTTIGVYISDVFDWDPQLLPSDIFSLHIYSENLESEEWVLEPAFNRSKAQIKCVSETYTKPWIIGETGFWGVDNVYPVPYPQVLTAADQKWFAENMLKYTNWYGAKGFSWWQYKDKQTVNDSTARAKTNFHGLVKRENNDQEQKLAGATFQNYDPDIPCSDCFDYENAINPFGYDYLMAEGTVVDENGVPLENVYISAQTGESLGYKSYKTYSYPDPNSDDMIFKIFTEDESVVFDKIRFGYPGKELYVENEQLTGVLNIVIPDYDPSLIPSPIPPPPTTYVIEDGEDITWDYPLHWKIEEVTVETGAKLTIKSYQFFDSDAKIIVKRGAHLVIDGATLTSGCNGLWGGIEVWGNSNAFQNPLYQGFVEIINGATIENSKFGVVTNRTDPNTEGGYVAGYTGGIIQASGANFINNETAVFFDSYPVNSESWFVGCAFQTNEGYMGDSYPLHFMKLVSIDRVRITNCDFINNVPTGNYQKGIYSLGAYIILKGSCISGDPCTDWDHGLFQNLRYGIYATVAGSVKHIDIEHTDFNDNFRGLYIDGMENPRVVSNNFRINEPFTIVGGYGMYLNHSTGYEVEENNFYHDFGAATGIGLIVNESGKSPNRIYRNYFTGLECGMDIQGENRDKSGIGLQLLCNTYEGTLMDKIITWDSPVASPYAGIASIQGSSGTNPEDMAGNLFEVPSQTPNDDFDDILNEANKITYYYPSNSEEDNVEPVDYTDNSVFLEEVLVDPEWAYANGCPPSEPGGGGTEGGRALMAAAQTEIDSLNNILSVLIDGGDTESLQNDVDNSVPPETMQVYNELMGKSPYLSDSVISTAIEKEDVLPGAMIRDILVANPKAAKSDELMDKLDQRWDPLPDYMKAQILQGQSIVSIREETESRLAASIQDEAKGFSSIIRGFIVDTIDPGASNDSLLLLFEDDSRLSSKYSLAFMRLIQGDGNLGQSVLNEIPQQFELSDIETAEHQQLASYYNILLDLVSDGKSILELNSSQIDGLMAMEASQQGMASVYARNILLALNEIDYEEPIILPDMLKSSEAVTDYEELLGKATEAPGFIKIQPNPAKDYIILKYDLEKEADAVIDINGLSGKLMHTESLRNKNDEIVIDIRDWKPGIYITTLKIDGEMVEGVKFTIVD